MTSNFRFSSGETSQLIASGSSGTGARLIIYPIDVEQAASPHQGLIDNSLFNTSSIGQDVFLFISGAKGDKNSTNQSITAFGGDAHISGNLSANAGNFASGLTGALNILPGGAPFLIAGTSVTLSTGSTGAITINSTATGGNTIWGSDVNEVAFTTGSVQITGSLIALSLSASNRAYISGALLVNAVTSSFTGSLVVTKQLQGGGVANTAATFPGIAFDGDADTGLWVPEANRIIVVAGGSTVLDLNNNDAKAINATNAGTVTVPIFGYSSDSNTGIYFPSANDQIAIAAGGVKKLEANTSGLMTSGTLDVSGSTFITGALNVKGDAFVSGSTRISGGQISHVTVITGNYTMLASDYIIAVSAAATYVTATLPVSPEQGAAYTIKDILGTAGTYPITVTSSAEIEALDGESVYTIDFAYGSATFVFFSM